MKKLLTFILGVSIAGMAWADTTSSDEVMKKIQELESRINELQKRVAETGVSREEVSDMVRQELDRTVDTGAWAQSKDVSPMVSLSEHVSRFDIQGDLRIRYEVQERQTSSISGGEERQQRFRTRLRLQGTWQTNEGWEVVVGLATGEQYAPTGGTGSAAANSSNDTWSQDTPFETGNIYLDYAYAKHTWESEGSEFTLTLGQQKNPFETSDIFWDRDVRPAGITGHYTTAGLFVTAGGYEVMWGGRDETSAQLGAVQIGFQGEVADGTNVLLATSYYHYNAATTDVSGPTAVPFTLDPDYFFEIGDVFASVDTTAGDFGLGLWGHYWRNFGAGSDFAGLGTTGQLGSDITTSDADDMDTGYALGVEAQFERFTLGYTYARVEADSVPIALKDSDFGSTAGLNSTDVKGHRVSGKVNLTKNFSLGLTYMDLESIDDDDERDGELFQLDAVYKF